MSTRTLLDGGDLDLISDGDGEDSRCHWDESVCTETPTHYLLYPAGEGTEALTYCARHHGLTLAVLLELHLPRCHGSVEDHIVGFGALSDASGAGRDH
ncbi:hypothetical protein [Gephyromycinifex aptenodytis]|uniref:hypothetical protein n=1 Tax=Gephyromycinifex aptenodytis TaxID=2716227 RepID=UPI001444EFAC|nr:hypothetical protein [Gephyromycinifex aptenodytis]